MDISRFIEYYQISPDRLDGPELLTLLIRQMELGLNGVGKIPMIPSYLPLQIQPFTGEPCCVMDAGGTNLRYAKAVFRADGKCVLSGLTKTAMPGTQGELSAEDFYMSLGSFANKTGHPERIGLCFSYNVLIRRDLDGVLHSWCKEVRVRDAPGKAVGGSLRQAIGPDCKRITVLNDSTAALLGAHSMDPDITVGLILGTGINVCYPEPCCNISKVPQNLNKEAMIISTEIGEFDAFPKTAFDTAVISASDEPSMAHAEKQCAGAYLGDLICHAWKEALKFGLVDAAFGRTISLPQISAYLAGTDSSLPQDENARIIARTMIHRSAKIAAILTAGPVLRCSKPGSNCTIAIEGSQFHKLAFFGDYFIRELTELLIPKDIRFSIKTMENSCLIGAALAAFAEPM